MKLPHNLYALIAIAIGIIGAASIQIAPLCWLLTGLVIIAAGIILRLYKGNIGSLILLGFLIGGGFWFSMARSAYLRQIIHNQTLNEQKISVAGTVILRPKPSRNGYWFVMGLPKPGPDRMKHPQGRVMVFIKDVPSDDWYGRKLRVTGRFEAFPGKTTGFPDYLEIDSITGSISVAEPPQFETGYGLPPPFIWADRIRRRLTGFGRTVLEPRNARLLHGIIFGDSLGGGDEKFLMNLQRTSTIHLLSVSGMHVGFVALSLNFLLGLFRIPKRWRIGPLIAGVWFYIMMTGMDPPALRAGIMLMIMLIGDVLRARDIPLNRLSLAAIILLLITPFNLFDISFQLTFTATFGVSCLYPLLVEFFPVKRRCLGLLWKALLVSLSAQLMLAPFLIHYFQMISWVAPLANIILLIPGETAVIGGLAGEAVGNFQPWLGGLILVFINYLLNFIRSLINWLGAFPWAASWASPWPWPWFFGYYLGLGLILDALRPNLINQKKRRFKAAPVLIGSLLLINLIVWGLYLVQLRGDYLQVVFLDVGQGDAILVRSLNGKYALVDGGDEGRGKRAILPYFRKNGVLRLERVFLSHYHKDHWGGLIEVLERVPVESLLLPPGNQTADCLRFEGRLGSAKVNPRTVCPGMFFNMGEEAGLEVLEVPDLKSENDRSIVLLIVFGKIRLLLTGDLSFKGEELLLKKCPHRVRAALLKVGHHGSNYASGLPFLSQVKPGLAMISAGAKNRFGHPGSDTINRLRSLGVKVFRTDTQGIIECRIYKDRILVRTAKDGK
jgi:competence protein ComEC